MFANWAYRAKCSVRIVCVCIISFATVGCQHIRKQSETLPNPCPPQKSSVAQSEINALKQALTSSEKKVQSLGQEISALKIQAIERESLVSQLQIKSEAQHKSLEAAIVDVVRSKAKLRSLESKAEAASTIAEAEIAVKALQSRAASTDWVSLDEIAIAEHLLKMSAQEFDTQNYGGALYLANQTKSRVRTAQQRLNNIANIVLLDGEASFAQPVSLKVLKNSNLRIGPGLEYKILTELEKGSKVIGFAYMGSWIHVDAPEGMTGWIFQTLVESQ
jgi:predicted RNase H-like nuclease (RuvC/YqgF family)